MSAWEVPMVNEPAGTQTCSIPNASVRTWPALDPSDGVGVGGTVAAAEGTVRAAGAVALGWAGLEAAVVVAALGRVEAPPLLHAAATTARLPATISAAADRERRRGSRIG